jgi:hypothetical protein
MDLKPLFSKIHQSSQLFYYLMKDVTFLLLISSELEYIFTFIGNKE